MKPKIDELWEAIIRFWPGDERRHMIVKIYYVWHDGAIQFVPLTDYSGDPIWAESCYEFTLLSKLFKEE